ncbi:MAG TPA: sulfite exporter TauE/SafE family protein [Rhizomicrobium sp.]|nr:sulfite exporter TauE/SafE family protein [Rhizomicrobium sp.]
MEIYLPIAEMSVHWLAIVALGAMVGMLSGMFGVSGGFLLTPVLIFYGIPAPVAVATTASHMTASSMSGALSQWRRKAIDFKMAAVMLGGGILGTVAGVALFALLRAKGQTDLVVSVSYVVLLGTVGGMMLSESLGALRAARAGTPVPARRAGQHTRLQRLPWKMRFKDSRLYISVIPPAVLGAFVGILSAVMGVGGGFILVPAMIYILRMPANMVVGTSLAQILCVTAVTTVLQAASNFNVDIVLALFLILGGVLGAQLGTRLSTRLRGEHLRLLLALIIVGVALRLFWGLVAAPADLYSLQLAAP